MLSLFNNASLFFSDPDDLTDLRGNIDYKVVQISFAVIGVYYLLGILLYGLVDNALGQEPSPNLDNSTDDKTTYYCDGNQLISNYSEPKQMPLSYARRFADAFYWTTCTVSTIGYGDMSPPSSLIGVRIFTMFFALAGIGIFSVAVGVVIGFFKDIQEKNITNQNEELLISGRSKDISYFEIVASEVNAYLNIPTKAAQNEKIATLSKGTVIIQIEKKGNWLYFSRNLQDYFSNKTGQWIQIKDAKSLTKNIARYEQPDHSIRNGVLKALGLLALNSAIGTIFMYIEKKYGQNDPNPSFLDCIYFATITATTVGLGDESPQSIGGRIFAGFYLIVSVNLFLTTFMYVAQVPLLLKQQRIENQTIKQYGDSLSRAELKNIIQTSSSNGKYVTEEEFVIGMLQKLKKLDSDDLKMAYNAFDELDDKKDGVLNLEDVLTSQDSN